MSPKCSRSTILVFFLVWPACGCTRGAAKPQSEEPVETSFAGPSPPTQDHTEKTPSLVGPEPTVVTLEAPPLYSEDGSLLPQNEETPAVGSPWFQKNARLLFDAIVADDVELAIPFFFPKPAYAQVKAIKDPDRDWDRRLKSAFKKDIHDYHLALGKARDRAEFSGISVRENSIKWVKPGEEGNRLGYYRILRSVLAYRDHEGRSRELALLSMISWRGEWYIVHLAPFR